MSAACCGPGLEYEYDGENRLVRVRKDTNNAQGLPDGQGGQTPIAEQNVQMEFVYDALGRRVETIEYVDASTGQVRDGQGSNPSPRRIRHVYFGLELIQEYACGGGRSAKTPRFTGKMRPACAAITRRAAVLRRAAGRRSSGAPASVLGAT